MAAAFTRDRRRRHGAGAHGVAGRCRRHIIANAVDLPGHPAIVRLPAHELQPDSDLGARLVTRDVGALRRRRDRQRARVQGSRRARQLLAAGLIEGAALRLLGETVVVGATGIGPAPQALHGNARRNVRRMCDRERG